MPTVYYLIRSRIDSLIETTKLKFNVLDQDGISQSTVFTVAWDQPDQVSPLYCEPSNPALIPGNIVYLALSKAYCVNQGFLTVGLGKRPDYLGTDGPSGGWFTLPALRPKSLLLETHDGTTLDLLDDKLVMPGGISSAENGLSLVISSAAKAMLGVAGALDPYVEPDPSERPSDPSEPADRNPDVDHPMDGRPPPEDAPGRPKTPERPTPYTPGPGKPSAGDADARARLSELFLAIGRVLELPKK